MNSDEEILNATCSVLKIFNKARSGGNRSEVASESSQYKCKNEPNFDVNSLTIDSLSCDECPLTNSFEGELLQNISPKTCLEYQNVLETLEVINMIYNSYNKQSDKKDNCQQIVDNFKDIILPSEIQIKIDAISTVLNHLKIITERKAKLKQVLRSNIMNDFWKIRAEYHKSVVQFFNTAKEVVSDIREFLEAIEVSKRHNPEKLKNFHLLEMKLLAKMHENIEILSEFRNYVQSLIS